MPLAVIRSALIALASTALTVLITAAATGAPFTLAAAPVAA